jgi:hypothetical protein
MTIRLNNKSHDIEFIKYNSDWSLKLDKYKVINHKGDNSKTINIRLEKEWYHTSLKVNNKRV